MTILVSYQAVSPKFYNKIAPMFAHDQYWEEQSALSSPQLYCHS